MTLQEFYNKYNGQANVGNTEANRGECVGLSSLWMDNFGVPHVYGHAKDLYKNAPDEFFVKIPNTPSAIVQEGDIVVWGAGYNGTYGHTGVAKGKSDVNNFECFQQNDPLGSKPHIKKYNYAYVTGWLRPKNNPAIIAQPIAQEAEITPQTKLPMFENKEQQQVRAEYDAKDRALADYEQKVEKLNSDVESLSEHIKTYTETHKDDEVEIVTTTFPVSPETPPETVTKDTEPSLSIILISSLADLYQTFKKKLGF